MKRIAAILILSLAAVAAMAQPLRTSQIITDSVSSTLLGEEVKVNVYLPQGYDASADRLYPVVYLLHGLSDTYSAWKEPTQTGSGVMKSCWMMVFATFACVPRFA